MRARALLLLAVATMAVSILVPHVRAGTKAGNFHVFCAYSHSSQDDPIVFPGASGATHLHDFFGNVSTNASSSFGSMGEASGTCDDADRSGYWAPSLIAPDGTVVRPDRISVYYWASHVGPASVPPSDLRIVAGGDTRNLRAAGYACGQGRPVSSTPLDCGGGDLRGVITFPQCWDGAHTDSPDHRSHMAYMTGKGCPSSHPVVLPKIVFHIRYGIQNGSGYYLSSDAGAGMTGGMSLHADLWNVWAPDRLGELVRSCVNAGVTC